MFTVDLTNATKYPDIDQFYGFTTVSLIYMYIASTVPDFIAIVGNIIVLYTSFRYKSFNLCKITVTLLEHLAAADLLHVVVGLFPKDLVILFTKTWTFGKVLCAINGCCTLIFGTAGIYILVIISLHRLKLLSDPFWLSVQQRWKLQLFMAGLWSIASIPSLSIIFSNSTIYYDPYHCSCNNSGKSENDYFTFILAFVFLGIPVLLIIICNIKILIIAVQYKRKMFRERGASSSNINALVTVTCICWVFIISWIPYAVRVMAETQSAQLPKWFFIFQAHVLRLNVVMNPIIYTCTIRSFKACVKERVLGKIFKSLRKPTGNRSLSFELTGRVQTLST